MRKILFIFVLSLIPIKVISQNEKDNFNISRVNLKVNSARRIPDNKIYVEISYVRRKYEVRLESKPLNDDKLWEDTKIDTTFFIDKKKFEDIKASLKKIDPNDFFTDKSYDILDGYSTKLTYSRSSGEVSYGFSNPNAITESRGLTRYLCTCALILETAGLGKGKVSYLLN